MKVQALQGDTVDLLCWRHYGRTQGIVEQVLQANPNLVEGGIQLAAGQWVELPFVAELFKGYRFRPNYKMTLEIEKPTTVSGRWAVNFSSDDSPAIGVFKEAQDKTVKGTFLTTTGDYRYLAGSYEHGLLRLSCFDGSHAFLFHARMQSDGTLQGDFWSGAKWHETWTAKRDEKAALPPGRMLIPGVVTHHTTTVEHPRLVADRIVRFARLVGRENVIAGTDCGLSRVSHASIQWAKFRAMRDGAEMASKELWGR